jgi:hypothetical protein
MNSATSGRPALVVIEGNRRAIEERAIQAIIFEPERLPYYLEQLRRKGVLHLVAARETRNPNN